MCASGQANLEAPTMKEAVVFAGVQDIPGRVLRAIAAAAICIAISTASADAQFLDFLFGGRPEAKPPPSEAKPAGNNAPHGEAKGHKTKPKKRRPNPCPIRKRLRRRKRSRRGLTIPRFCG